MESSLQKLLALILACVVVSGCGKEGPMGPAGPAGTGTTFFLEGDMSTQSHLTVSVPNIHISNLPIVIVYSRLTQTDGSKVWVQMNVYIEDSSGVPFLLEYAVIHEGAVEIFSGNGDRYRVAVIFPT